MQDFNPHEYQTEAIKFLLINSNAGLFFDPGLGKTACVLAAISVLKARGLPHRTLVVAPQRVAKNVWTAEIAKWSDFANLSCVVLHGPHKTKLAMGPGREADIIVTTPDLVKWVLERNVIGVCRPEVLVVDESSFYRHTTSQRFKNLRGLLPMFKRRIILTGTPAPRGYEDLFPQIFIVDQGGALGKYITHYRSAYFDNVGFAYPDWRLRKGADVLINEKLRPLVLRGDAVEHLEMPKLVINNVQVEMPTHARPIYIEMAKKFLASIEGVEVMAPNSAALSNKLRQITNGFVYDADHTTHHIHSAKLDALEELLGELNGQPALVLYEYEADRDAILGAIKNVTHFASGLSGPAAESIITRFNAGEIPILLAHPKSSGHGLNLQGASGHIVWFGPTWDLELHDQATARVWRQGNPNARVFLHTLVVKDTIDEAVARALSFKNKTQQSLLVALKGTDHKLW